MILASKWLRIKNLTVFIAAIIDYLSLKRGGEKIDLKQVSERKPPIE